MTSRPGATPARGGAAVFDVLSERAGRVRQKKKTGRVRIYLQTDCLLDSPQCVRERESQPWGSATVCALVVFILFRGIAPRKGDALLRGGIAYAPESIGTAPAFSRSKYAKGPQYVGTGRVSPVSEADRRARCWMFRSLGARGVEGRARVKGNARRDTWKSGECCRPGVCLSGSL